MSSLGFHSVSNHSVPVKVVQAATPAAAPAPEKRKRTLKSAAASAKSKLRPKKKLVIKIRKPF